MAEAEIENTSERISSSSKIRRSIILSIVAVGLLMSTIYGARYYLYASTHESTDDAFIEGKVIQVNPKVSGQIVKVYISDNQQVKAGDLLLEIDARDYETRLTQAKAALSSAEAKQKTAQANVALTKTSTTGTIQQATSGVSVATSAVATAKSQVQANREKAIQAREAINAAQSMVKEAQSQVAAVEAEAKRSNADVQRYRQLYERDEVSKQSLDQATAAAQAANAQVQAAHDRVAMLQAQLKQSQSAAALAEVNIRQAENQVTTVQAQVGEARGRLMEAAAAPRQIEVSQAQVNEASFSVEQARAAVEQAELQLSYTKIYAPQTGRVTRKGIEAGSFVQVGQALMAIVPSELWVVGNFKETQLELIRPNQTVEIKVDAFPNKTFKGHVESIQRGTGSRFSMMPPENATGNFVKVVQRVPVKIVFDEYPDAQHPIGPGMSAVPEVKVK